MQQINDCNFDVYPNASLVHADSYVTPLHSPIANMTETECGTMCALLLACRLFQHDNLCHLYSIDNIGAEICKNDVCNDFWVNDADHDCVVVMGAQYRQTNANATVLVKQNCCFINE